MGMGILGLILVEHVEQFVLNIGVIVVVASFDIVSEVGRYFARVVLNAQLSNAWQAEQLVLKKHVDALPLLWQLLPCQRRLVRVVPDVPVVHLWH